MTNATQRLLDEALDLPDSERAELAARLIESLDAAEQDDVDAAWAAEIERRCTALDSGEAVASDWSEARARIEREIFGR
jgi:putative addiction module component (TIGR02574 family)